MNVFDAVEKAEDLPSLEIWPSKTSKSRDERFAAVNSAIIVALSIPEKKKSVSSCLNGSSGKGRRSTFVKIYGHPINYTQLSYAFQVCLREDNFTDFQLT